MNRFVFAGAVAAALLLPCSAAGARPVNWSGRYAGADVGWGSLVNIEQTVPAAAATSGQFSGDGILGGATLGVNWQSGVWVAGLEGDYSATSIRGEAVNIAPACTANQVGTCYAKVDHLFTFRARAGFLMNNVLLYGTGGLAYGAVSSGFNVPGDHFGAKQYELGWTLGAGFEGALSGRWTAKLEYLFVDLPAPSYSIPGPFQYDTSNARTHIVRLGLNYRFGGN